MKKVTRRNFVQSVALGASAFVLPRFSIAQSGPSANSKLNIAVIGVGGIAGMAFPACSDENIVALCDVDELSYAQHVKNFPVIGTAPRFKDFRVMLDKMGHEIDAVCINTPDHTHFAATMEAMQRGKHVCTQKPLTHNIWQARTLRLAAKKYPSLVTNMGNQGHTYSGIRRMKEWIDVSLLGDVTEIHAGVNGPNWKGSYFRHADKFPLPSEPVPPTLDWNLWQGPTAQRAEYNHLYHPRWWRGFWQYGGGEIGDWFCHIGDGPVWALDLYEPTVVECVERQETIDGMCPTSSMLRWDFPARGNLVPCSIYWNDGIMNGGTKIKVPADWNWSSKDADGIVSPIPAPQQGSYWYGSKFNAYLDERSNNPRLVNMEKDRELKNSNGLPPHKYPEALRKGPHEEWISTIKAGGGAQCGSHFDYAARLTEIDLLGVIVQRFGGRIEWDAAKMKITNRPELNEFLKEPVLPEWDYGVDLWKSA